jgi:N-acetylglucosamine-6-phosphate deacetylase
MKIIDIHTHGIGGYDTKSNKVEDILKIAEILGAQGVSEIILTIYPSSIKVMRENMIAVKKAMERQKSLLSSQQSAPPPIPPPRGGRVREGVKAPESGLRKSKGSELRTPKSKTAQIIGVHLEGPFLNPSKCGALASRAFLKPIEYNFRQLIEGFEDIVRIITIAPEIKGAVKLIKKVSDRGIMVSMGHSDATFSEAEAGFNSGARGITHLFNAMRGFYHREPGIAGFGLINEDIYIEVIADPFHLHPKTLELIFRIKNPEKIIIVSDSVKETPYPIPLLSREGAKGRGIGRGKVRAVTDTHGKLLGGSMTIIESSKRLIQMGFDEDIIMRCMTVNPRRFLKSLSL